MKCIGLFAVPIALLHPPLKDPPDELHASVWAVEICIVFVEVGALTIWDELDV